MPGSSKGVSIIGPRVLRPRPAGSSRGTNTMFGIIRVRKTDHFCNGSGSSDPNRPKILKITVSYHMELGGSSRWSLLFGQSPLFGHSPRSQRITVASSVASTVASAVAFRGAPQSLTPLSKILAGTLPEPSFWRGGGQDLR